MPMDMRLAINVMGKPVRTEILYHLSVHPRTSIELADLIGVHHTSIHRHLGLLEQLDLVTADVGPGHRRGQTVRWHTDIQKVGQLGRLWVAYATGQHLSPVMPDDNASRPSAPGSAMFEQVPSHRSHPRLDGLSELNT